MDLIDIARLEELRQARGITEIADEWRPLAGGSAARGEPGSWINNAVGAGLDGPIDDDELDSVIEWYTSKGIEPRLEVCPFVHESLLTALERRGFSARAFENVFFRELDGSAVGPVHALPPGVRIGRVDPGDAAMVREYGLAVVSGFFPPDVAPREADLEVSARSLRHPRTCAYAAWVDGKLVGGGAMEVGGEGGEVAALFGLSVLPEHRRRGIQGALIAARLNEAARRGARIATIGSRPGVATERNVRRMGFTLAYTKLVMAKAGPGLAAVLG